MGAAAEEEEEEGGESQRFKITTLPAALFKEEKEGLCFTLQAEFFIWSPMKCESGTCGGLRVELGAIARRGEGWDLTGRGHSLTPQTDMFRSGEACPEAGSKLAQYLPTILRPSPLGTGSL